MRAVLVPVGQEPRLIDLESDENGSTLHSLQKAVGGLIEPVSWVFGDKPTIWVNEEGIIQGLQPNRAVYASQEMVDAGILSMDWKRPAEKGECVFIGFGDMVCTGFDEATGKTIPITDEEAEAVFEMFRGDDSIASGIEEVLRIKLGLG